MAELRSGQVEQSFYETFDRCCKICNSKSMAAVMRDLADGFNKSVRKAQQWPGNFEAPVYRDIINQAVKLVLKGQSKGSFYEGESLN